MATGLDDLRLSLDAAVRSDARKDAELIRERTERILAQHEIDRLERALAETREHLAQKDSVLQELLEVLQRARSGAPPARPPMHAGTLEDIAAGMAGHASTPAERARFNRSYGADGADAAKPA